MTKPGKTDRQKNVAKRPKFGRALLACLFAALLTLGPPTGAHAEVPILLPPTEEELPPGPIESVPGEIGPTTDPPSRATAPAENGLTENHPLWVDEEVWWPLVGWEGSVEFGLNGSSGNTQTFNIHSAANFVRKTADDKFTLDVAHNQATDDNVETKNNAQLTARHEILFGESPWSLFTKLGLEYDEFKAFDLRLVLNSGVGYRWIKSESTTLISRFGAGTSHEIGGPDDSWTPEAVFGLDLERQLTKMQKLTAKAEYLPDWGDFENYRVVTDIAWVIALDVPHNVSVKLSVNDQYDSTPNGDEPNDINYAALLLWKF